MPKSEIQAVEMTRRIRARHAEELRHATPEVRIAFYRERARTVATDVEKRRHDEVESRGMEAQS